mgnify:CR=1 FL=1
MKKIVFVGEKETFVIRVLEKKIKEANMEAVFINYSVDSLNSVLTGECLVTLYIDDDTVIGEDVLHFLEEKMREGMGYFGVIGEQIHINSLKKRISEDYIYKEFVRPVNNEEFVEASKLFFEQETKNEAKKRILIVDDDPQYLSLIPDCRQLSS